MKRKFNKNIFFGSILPYVLVVLLVFTAQSVSNSVVLKALENNALNVVEKSFRGSVLVMEENLGKVKETAISVAQNVPNKFDGDKLNKVYTRMTEARALLRTYFVSSGIIENICVQNDENDLMVSFNNVYSKRINFYRSMLKSDTKTSPELLLESEKASGFIADSGLILNGEDEVISFFFPTPMIKKRTGSVSVYINKNTLLLPVREFIDINGGVFLIVDETGNPILDAGKDSKSLLKKFNGEDAGVKKRIDGNNYYAFSYRVPETGWTYSMYLPEETVMHDTNYYETFSVIFNFVALVIGFILCLFFVLRKSESYIELLEMLGIDSERFEIKNVISKNEYKYLSQHISKVKDENEKLLERDNQNVLRKLLTGKFEQKEDMYSELSKHSVVFDGTGFAVMVISYSRNQKPQYSSDNFRVFLLREIQRIIPGARVYFEEKNSAVIVFSYDGEDFREKVDMYISKLEIEVLFNHRMPVVFGVGNSVDDIYDVSFSYKQAQDVVRYNILLENKNIRFYQDLPDGTEDYYYPSEMYNELFDSVLEANFENARDTLRKIQEENFQNRNLSLESIDELLSTLRSNIKKIGKLQTEQLEFVEEQKTVSHFFECAISFFYILCSGGSRETMPRNQRICLEVQRYIERYYNEPNLTLSSIANEFRLHPNYLSTVFKKNMNCGLMNYLETVRIEKSIELLADGKYSINEIARMVGFTNDGTFRRTFKKIKGATPSNFIKS